MVGYLVLADGSRIEVRDGLTLGRIAQCDVVLQDSKASRRHARMVVEGSVVEIEDLGSSNGTYLNDKPIQRRLLRDGDQIRIGTTTVAFAEAKEGAPEAEVEIELDPDVAVEIAEPRPSPDPDGPGGVLEGDPLVGQESPPDNVEVLEFVDEVVTVKKRAPGPSPAQTVPRASSATRPEETDRREHGVLSYSKRQPKRGLLGDDLRQMSATRRTLLMVGVLVAALVLGYAVMKVVAGS